MYDYVSRFMSFLYPYKVSLFLESGITRKLFADKQKFHLERYELGERERVSALKLENYRSSWMGKSSSRKYCEGAFSTRKNWFFQKYS